MFLVEFITFAKWLEVQRDAGIIYANCFAGYVVELYRQFCVERSVILDYWRNNDSESGQGVVGILIIVCIVLVLLAAIADSGTATTLIPNCVPNCK